MNAHGFANRRWWVRPTWVPLGLQFLAAALAFLAGWQMLQSSPGSSWPPFRGASTLVLVLLAGCHLAWAARLRRRPLTLSFDLRQVRRWLEWQVVGLVAAMGLGLSVGPRVGADDLVRGVMALWMTLSLWPLWADASWQPLLGWTRTRGARWTARGVVFLSLGLVGGEMFLRMTSLVLGERAATRIAVRDRKLEPGRELHGQRVNRLGYWDKEFESTTPLGQVRIAALGPELLLSGSATTNCLARLEALVPELDVYNFGVAQTGPREFALQVQQDVSRYGADFVLVFLNPAEQLARGGDSIEPYDWRSLRLIQVAADRLNMRLMPEPARMGEPRESSDYEGFLRQTAPQLAACARSAERDIEPHWGRLQRDLNQLSAACQARSLPWLLVLVPSEFQVSSTLRDTLARRVGQEPQQLDIELPQRRVASWAQGHNVPVVDLLPYFRSAESNPYARCRAELSPAGNQLAAETLAQWVQARVGRQVAMASP